MSTPNPSTPASEAREWLVKAHHDLEALATLLSVANPVSDICVFHAQQAAEKAVKAFMVYHSIAFPFIHDIDVLLRLALPTDPSLASLRPAAQTLTPYAVQFRYPVSAPDPTPAEARTAEALARDVYQAILARLPAAAHP